MASRTALARTLRAFQGCPTPWSPNVPTRAAHHSPPTPTPPTRTTYATLSPTPGLEGPAAHQLQGTPTSNARNAALHVDAEAAFMMRCCTQMLSGLGVGRESVGVRARGHVTGVRTLGAGPAGLSTGGALCTRQMTSGPAAAYDVEGSTPVVGFVGLGNMGGPMALNLLEAGFKVLVSDMHQAAIERLTSAGAVQATSAGELTRHADVIVTMLPSPAAVREVYTGNEGFFSSAAPLRTALFIDSSTVDPDTAKAVARASTGCYVGSRDLGAAHPLVLDAPVSGGVPGAQAGTLSFMVGGERHAFTRAAPVLGAMGKKVVHCGPAGAGSAAKLCNNLALGIQMASVSEALALGQRLGLDPKMLSSIFNNSSARCWSSDTYNPAPGVMESVPSANGYKGGFTCALMVKDLNLALQSAHSVGARVDLGSAVHTMYKTSDPENDFSCIYKQVYGGEPSES